MAISLGAALIGSALIGGGVSAFASSKAASAQADASKAAAKSQTAGLDKAVAEQRRQFDLVREDAAPFRAVGTEAAMSLADMMGLNVNLTREHDQEISAIDQDIANLEQQMMGSGKNKAKGIKDQIANLNFEKEKLLTDRDLIANRTPYEFEQSPGYQFRMNEGLKGLERFAAAGGSLNSGSTLKAMNRYAQDYASGEYGQEFGRLASLAGFANQPSGSSESANIANMYMNQGNAQAQNLLNMGNARASMYGGINQAFQGTLGNLSMLPFLLQAYEGGTV